MATKHPTDTDETLRARIDRLEREQHLRIARANAALAAAQDKNYWLDRWRVDLNELMRKPGAGEFRAAVRAARSVYRTVYDARWKLHHRLMFLRARVGSAGDRLAEERELSQEQPVEFFSHHLGPDLLRATPVTDRLYARLDRKDIAAIQAQLESDEATTWETVDASERKRLALAFAAHYHIDGALERSGLRSAMPSEEVHSMARGAMAAGGSTYYADMVVDALADTGFELREGQSGLDFGCSSGRVVRVLAAAYPELDWHGCDPITDAIEWAQANLPGVSFELSPEYPPLPYGDGTFDFVFGISIWSHFSEGAALDWFGEMRRVIRPGGRLVLSTHGLHTIAHTHREGVRSTEQLAEVRSAMLEDGFWYAPEFGERGDHGVANPDWGTAFLTSEWLLTKLSPYWPVLFFRPGRLEGNQDLYVLERR